MRETRIPGPTPPPRRRYSNDNGTRTKPSRYEDVGTWAHVDLWVSVRETRGHLSAKTIHRCPTVSRPVLFVRQTALSPIFRRKTRQKRPLRTAASRYAEHAERPENDLSVGPLSWCTDLRIDLGRGRITGNGRPKCTAPNVNVKTKKKQYILAE